MSIAFCSLFLVDRQLRPTLREFILVAALQHHWGCEMGDLGWSGVQHHTSELWFSGGGWTSVKMGAEDMDREEVK